MNDKINKVLLGDCYKLIKGIPDNSIDLVYIDIPYLYASGGSGNSLLAQRIIAIKEDIKEISDGIDYGIFEELIRVMKKINIFIWCSKSQIPYILNYFIDKGCSFEILVWIKNNAIPSCNNTWLPDIEYCLYFREKGVHLNDGYELKKKWFVSSTNQKDKQDFLHPTIKPLNLVKRHILHTTQPNDIVLDCFAGSCTTGVACKETNRKYICIEKDSKWYEIGKNRVNGILPNGQMTIFSLEVKNER